MDDQLRRTLNEKLDGLSAPDLVPGFDREQLWASIEAQLGTETPRRRGFPLWSYAAAAVFAGMLIGGFTARFFRDDRTAGQVAHIEPRVDTAAPVTIAAVPVQPKGIPPVLLPTKPPARRNRSTTVAPKQVAALRQAPQSQAVNAIPPPAAEQPSALVATTPQIHRKPRAVHILDIDAQSRTAVLNDNIATPDKPDLLETITVRTMPEPGARNAPASVFRHP